MIVGKECLKLYTYIYVVNPSILYLEEKKKIERIG